MRMSKKPSKQSEDKDQQNKRPKGNMLFSFIVAVAVVLLISGVYNLISGSKYTETTYNDFLAAMNGNNLEEVEFRYDRIIYMTKEEAQKPASQQKSCFTGLPRGGDVMALSEKLDAMGVKN